MKTIISELEKIIHQTKDLIDFEEQVRLLMYDTFARMVGDVFTSMNRVIVKQKQSEGWTVERSDEREIQFTFGPVRFTHTLMYDLEGNARYPFDEWIGFKAYDRRSPFVDVKVAEMAAEITYREVARIPNEWTAVSISHTTVGNIVKKVGKAQKEADEELVKELEELVTKAKDPDAVSDAEIDAILNRVSSDFSSAQQKDIAKRVTGQGGRSAQAAIDNLRADLTAVKRALESQKV